MNFNSRKVAVTVVSVATGLVMLSAVIINGESAGTTDKNSGKNHKTAKYLAVEQISGDEMADISAREDILVGIADATATAGQIAKDSKSAESEAGKEETTEAVAQTPAEIQEQAAQPSPYENKFMVNVSEYLNIRSEQSEDSQVVGKLYAGSGGDVISRGEQWTQISSGSVTGYVCNDYIVIGAEAEAKANEVGKLKATVTSDNIRIREQSDGNSKIYGLADIGDVYDCTAQVEGWVQIDYDGGAAYISSEFATVELEVGKAISIEEEQAKLAEEARLEEKTVQEKQFEQQYDNEVSTVQTDAYNVSYDDAYLLACLVHSEAGSEPYEGKLATANVVLNRLRSGAYGNTISDVIYAPNQFSVVKLGTFAAALSSGPNSESVAAANEALSGVNNVPDYGSFCSTSVARYDRYNDYTVIGNQVYYR